LVHADERSNAETAAKVATLRLWYIEGLARLNNGAREMLGEIIGRVNGALIRRDCQIRPNGLPRRFCEASRGSGAADGGV
jgi:hypothetical protein